MGALTKLTIWKRSDLLFLLWIDGADLKNLPVSVPLLINIWWSSQLGQFYPGEDAAGHHYAAEFSYSLSSSWQITDKSTHLASRCSGASAAQAPAQEHPAGHRLQWGERSLSKVTVLKTDGKNAIAFKTLVDRACCVSLIEKGGFARTSFNQGNSEQELPFSSSDSASGRAYYIQAPPKLDLFS